jgi:hypothetical protein
MVRSVENTTAGGIHNTHAPPMLLISKPMQLGFAHQYSSGNQLMSSKDHQD